MPLSKAKRIRTSPKTPYRPNATPNALTTPVVPDNAQH